MKGLVDIDFGEWQPKKILSELNVSGVVIAVVSRFSPETPPTTIGSCSLPLLLVLLLSLPSSASSSVSEFGVKALWPLWNVEK